MCMEGSQPAVSLPDLVVRHVAFWLIALPILLHVLTHVWSVSIPIQIDEEFLEVLQQSSR